MFIVVDAGGVIELIIINYIIIVVSLSKTHLFLLNTGSTKEDSFWHNWKIVEWDVKNKIKQTNKLLLLLLLLLILLLFK